MIGSQAHTISIKLGLGPIVLTMTIITMVIVSEVMFC
jgi:hypothetical protein